MKFKAWVWRFMTGRMKKGLKLYRDDTNELLKKAKPIYIDLLSKMNGISDNNPMAFDIDNLIFSFSSPPTAGKKTGNRLSIV